MNERMLKLYKKAYVPAIAIDPSNNLHYETTTFSAEKFAELIVKECMTLAIDSQCFPKVHLTLDEAFRSGQEHSVRCIKEHFGVED